MGKQVFRKVRSNSEELDRNPPGRFQRSILSIVKVSQYTHNAFGLKSPLQQPVDRRINILVPVSNKLLEAKTINSTVVTKEVCSRKLEQREHYRKNSIQFQRGDIRLQTNWLAIYQCNSYTIHIKVIHHNYPKGQSCRRNWRCLKRTKAGALSFLKMATMLLLTSLVQKQKRPTPTHWMMMKTWGVVNTGCK